MFASALVRPVVARRCASLTAALFFVAVPGCSVSEPGRSDSGGVVRAQLFDGMGAHHRTVSTTSGEAQKYFDQGLVWSYAFNHDEAVRSFEQAAQLDPSLAAAWWGVSLCSGPHINNPHMPEDRSRRAWESLQSAQRLRASASPVEQALIDALSHRYAWPAPADRHPLDQAYAEAMQRVHEQFPADPDVAVLYAESLMDLQPWDLWTLDGRPKGRALEVVRTLEAVLAAHPTHPGAAHLYIHTVEASKQPERAVAAADALRNLVPASGHLTHMPSHIDIRVGRWPDAAAANRRAIAADAAYRRLSPQQGFYRIYMQHNHGFLAFSCMMLGRYEESLAAADAALTVLPPDWVKENASLIDGYSTLRLEVLKRFGKWDELLAADAPPEYLPFTHAMWRLCRGIAFAAKGDPASAERERELFRTDRTRVPENAVAQINPAHRVLDLAALVLDGEIALARHEYDNAVARLREAVAIEDSLVYMEPPDWMVPARHTLGAVLNEAGRYAEAEQVYRDDLTRWPENGWSLLGLSRSLDAQGKTHEAASVTSRLDRVWSTADITAHASCLCVPAH